MNTGYAHLYRVLIGKNLIIIYAEFMKGPAGLFDSCIFMYIGHKFFLYLRENVLRSTTDTSILDEIIESTAKKRRWLMLPLYFRTIVIASVIFSGLFNLLLIASIYVAMDEGVSGVGNILLGGAIGIPLLMIYFLGTLFLWMEKKNAPDWAYASFICAAMLAFLLFATLKPMMGAYSIVLALLGVLHLFLIIKLHPIRKKWKYKGASKSELCQQTYQY